MCTLLSCVLNPWRHTKGTSSRQGTLQRRSPRSSSLLCTQRCRKTTVFVERRPRAVELLLLCVSSASIICIRVSLKCTSLNKRFNFKETTTTLLTLALIHYRATSSAFELSINTALSHPYNKFLYHASVKKIQENWRLTKLASHN